MNPYLAIVLGYALLQIAAGIWMGRRTRSTSEFFVAGRRLGPGLVFATMLAANIGAGSTVGATGLGYRDGIAAWWWVGSAAIGSFVLAFWVGPAMRREAARLDLRTVGDYLEHRYGTSVRVVIALLMSVGSIAILGGQLLALARHLEVIAGVPKLAGSLIGGAVVTAYFTAGGLMTSVRLNVLQLSIKLAGIGLALPFAVAGIGGWSALRAVNEHSPTYWSFWQGGLSGWPYVALLAPAFVVSPGLLQKVYGARDDRAARWGTAANALALLLYAIVPAILGIAARARFPDLASPDLALPMLLVRGVPTAVGGLGLAAVFSAEVSAADAVLFMLSTSLAQDLYKRFLRPDVDDVHLLRVTRLVAAGSGTAAVLLALAASTVIDALSIFYVLLSVSLFVPIVAGLYTRAGKPEAMAAIVAGVTSALALHLPTSGHGLGRLTPALGGTLAALLAFAVARVVRARSAIRAPSSNRAG